MYTSIGSSLPAVGRIWFGDSDVDPNVGHRSDPELGADLVFTILDASVVTRLQGPLTIRRTYPWHRAARYVGVRLTPGMGGCLDRHELWELENTSVPVEELWGIDLRRLGEQLAGMQTCGQMLGAVEDSLRTVPDLVGGGHPVVAECLTMIHDTRGIERIQTIADRVGYSRRHLERLFKRHVGLAPKHVARLVRAEAFSRLASGFEDLGRLAVQLGFADQPHLNREIRRIYGTTPSNLGMAGHPR